MTNEEAINHLKYLKVDSHIANVEALDLAIKALENRPKGYWKEAINGPGRSYFCSRCGTQEGKPYDDCPNCGADMRGDV